MSSTISDTSRTTAHQLEALQDLVPAIVFGTHPHPDKSDRYQFIDTFKILRGLIDNNWYIKDANQARTRKVDNRLFANHLVRLGHPNLERFKREINGGAISIPELIFENNHGLAGKGRMMMGFYSFACANKIIVGTSETSYSFAHTHGVTIDIILEEVDRLLTEYGAFVDRRDKMIGTKINPILNIYDPLTYLVRDWRDIRTNTLGDKYEVLTTLHELICPKRKEDAEPNLWNVFNIIQEKLISGDIRVKNIEKESPQFGKISKMKKLSGFKTIIDLNTEMWSSVQEKLIAA